MSSSANESVFRVELRCNDGEKVVVDSKETIKHLPAFQTAITKTIFQMPSTTDSNRSWFVTEVPFPKSPTQFLVDNVVLYTKCDTVEDVKGLSANTQEHNMLEIKQLIAVAKLFKCDIFVEALQLVWLSRGAQSIYLNFGENLRAYGSSSDTSGITFRFADKGEIFVGDRELIRFLPLYARMVESSCPNWKQANSKFSYFVKVPFSMRIVKTLFDCVKVYRVPPKVHSLEFINEHYPQSSEWTFEDLADFSEAAIFFETKIFEQVISYIALERVERFGKEDGVLHNFATTIHSFNYGFEPSTSDS